MKATIKIQDLSQNTVLDSQAMRAVKGGVAQGFLFRPALRKPGSPLAPVINNNFAIGEINYTVNNTLIDKFLQQTNNLSQINLTEVIAIDSSVDVSVDQGQLGINS